MSRPTKTTSSPNGFSCLEVVSIRRSKCKTEEYISRMSPGVLLVKKYRFVTDCGSVFTTEPFAHKRFPSVNDHPSTFVVKEDV